MHKSRKCTVPACNSRHHAKGFCKPHWDRWRRYDNPLGGTTFEGQPLAWLKAHVNYSGKECLLWPFARDNYVYARIRLNNRNSHAHSWMCERTHGPRPNRNHVCAHSCGRGNDGCLNPRHLRWATKSQNQLDRRAHATDPRGEGHPLVRLDSSSVLTIYWRAWAGELHQNIANQFGIDRKYVSKIKHRHVWQHILPTNRINSDPPRRPQHDPRSTQEDQERPQA